MLLIICIKGIFNCICISVLLEVINSNYQLSYIFQQLKDSLKLTATMAPALFSLLNIEDYKDETIRLLGMLVDSGYLKPEAYNSFLPELIIQAKNELKRQNSDVASNRYGSSSQSTLFYFLQILNEEIIKIFHFKLKIYLTHNLL